MLNARNTSLVLLTLAVTGLLVSIAQTVLPPSARRVAHDSFSGRAPGHRALVEVLEELGAPVARHEGVPRGLFSGNRRVVLLEPEIALLEREHGYIETMAAWVRGGGEVVIVSPVLRRPPSPRREREEEPKVPDQLLASLGISDLQSSGDLEAEDEERRFGRSFRWKPATYPSDLSPFLVRASGSLAYCAENIESLYMDLEEEPACFSGEALERARGRIEIAQPPEDTGEGEEEAPSEWDVIGLEFGLDQGSVTVLSCALPFSNLGIGVEDNSVFAFRTAVGEGDREIVVDEFYHGRRFDGNWLALLGRRPYGFIALFVLAAIACRVWMHAVRFGPPAPVPAPGSRNILEYTDAMGRLFHRAKKHHLILKTNRSGFIDDLREHLHLPYYTPESVVLHRLETRSPAEAGRLRKLLSRVDMLLRKPRGFSSTVLMDFQAQFETLRRAMMAPDPKETT